MFFYGVQYGEWLSNDVTVAAPQEFTSGTTGLNDALGKLVNYKDNITAIFQKKSHSSIRNHKTGFIKIQTGMKLLQTIAAARFSTKEVTPDTVRNISCHVNHFSSLPSKAPSIRLNNNYHTSKAPQEKETALQKQFHLQHSAGCRSR